MDDNIQYMNDNIVTPSFVEVQMWPLRLLMVIDDGRRQTVKGLLDGWWGNISRFPIL